MHEPGKMPKPLLGSDADSPSPPKDRKKANTYGIFIIFILNNLLILLRDKYQG
jgi:hypothetical protein